jgi:ABC-type Mn2+/Zn2+ transport system permease subunit/Mn-dependent DtxR family transcriptional regulator
MFRLHSLLGKCVGALALLAAVSDAASAAKISDLAQTGVLEQLTRFLSFRDPALQLGMLGATLLGFTCGLLGCYIVLRRLSLMGDTLGHSILPGVVLAFVLSGGQKSPAVLLGGAVLAGLAASVLVWFLTRHTPIKEDAAMGITLSSFFAVGVAGLTMLQKSGPGTQSGLDKFLFGQAAALGPQDVGFLAASAVAASALVFLLYKELLVSCFDAQFANSIGVPVDKVQLLLMGLVTVAIVSAVQAVGVVLVSAMLVIPAATALLWTDRLPRMLLLSSVLGMLAGWSGLFLSFVGRHLPTGPCMVLASTVYFGLSWLFAPRYGQLGKWLRHRNRSLRTALENDLKSVYLLLERAPHAGAAEWAAFQRLDHTGAQHRLQRLQRRRWLESLSPLTLSERGTAEAARLVRNHRLWELYLTHEAQIAPDHVHRDAEDMEHLLTPEQVSDLESRLGRPEFDPHGQRIPRS